MIPLPKRGLVSVIGAEAEAFVQGLVTTNVAKLAVGQTAPGAFLNAKGRVVHDVLVIHRSAGNLALDCSREDAPKLAAMLGKFKLRKKVVVKDESAERRAWFLPRQAEVHSEVDAALRPDTLWFPDPRPGSMGVRLWAPAGRPMPAATHEDDALYQQLRMALGIPEGPDEVADETTFVLNYDWWPEALSYEKGCYTVRAHMCWMG
jgi:folate-binding Fe-S cluster repair protein YgfZ